MKITKRQAASLRKAGLTVGTITHTPVKTPYSIYYVSAWALRQYERGKGKGKRARH